MNQVLSSKSPIRLALIIAVLGLLVLAGCGGDGNSEGEGTARAQADQAKEEAPGTTSDNQGQRGFAEGKQSGGGDDDVAAVESGGVDTEFVAEADALCAQSAERFQREAKGALFQDSQSGAGGEAQAIDDVVNDVSIPRLEEQASDLETLEGSPAEEDAAAEVATRLQQAIVVIKADPEAFFYGTVDELTDARRTALGLGFKRCGALF